jgi:hypothetical protein
VRLARQLALGLALYVCWHGLAWMHPSTGIIRIGLEDGRGHGCVVEGRLITAKHVGNRGSVTWQDSSGREGTAKPAGGTWDIRDVLVMETSIPVGPGFKLATERPKPGDKVKLYGYDRGKRDPFKFKVVEAEVIARSDGYVFYDRSPGPGSSGSCVLNEKDEVVAINVGIWQHGQEAFTPVGVEIVGGWSVK